ncbi:hypothetical protein HA050_15355 [Iodobacter sp. HSC-16F04]|uniref:Lipoprotein n=1 Tax=Iodobacter violaceini TaxID=3044271 RepID=A0ABX0KZR4_9NEIS|nr:hypothetical protein [Iodobacter violacea]NHQ87494.1 hypothetical protein [Iodobacter violacea]
MYKYLLFISIVFISGCCSYQTTVNETRWVSERASEPLARAEQRCQSESLQLAVQEEKKHSLKTQEQLCAEINSKEQMTFVSRSGKVLDNQSPQLIAFRSRLYENCLGEEREQLNQRSKKYAEGLFFDRCMTERGFSQETFQVQRCHGGLNFM